MGIGGGHAPVILTTRCPDCGTAFRVQPVQLSARGGKVRCGKCTHVFDGVAALVAEGPAAQNAGTEAEPSPQLALFEASRSTPLAGAGEIAAVDIDPQALETTTANARGNGVLLRVAAPEFLPPGTFDLIVANILAGPLIALAPLLAARTRKGGRIALSGILESQAAEVAAAYAQDFDAGVIAAEEGWVLVGGQRR